MIIHLICTHPTCQPLCIMTRRTRILIGPTGPIKMTRPDPTWRIQCAQWKSCKIQNTCLFLLAYQFLTGKKPPLMCTLMEDLHLNQCINGRWMFVCSFSKFPNAYNSVFNWVDWLITQFCFDFEFRFCNGK